MSNYTTVRRLKFMNLYCLHGYRPQNEYHYVGPPLNEFMRIDLANALKANRQAKKGQDREP